MKTRIINLTGRPIVFGSGGKRLTIDPDSNPAFLEYETKAEAIVNGSFEKVEIEGLPNALPLFRRRTGRIINLLSPEEGCLFITNHMVAREAQRQGRADVFGEDELVQEFDGDCNKTVIGFETVRHDPTYHR